MDEQELFNWMLSRLPLELSYGIVLSANSYLYWWEVELSFNALVLFWLFSATAQSVQTMIVGRLLAGIGIGISSAIVPLYISEVV